MSDNYTKKRDDFRQSKAWQNFRKRKYLEDSRDFITHKKLKSSYRLHHLDLDPENYQDLSDPNKFVNLNNMSHGWVHEIFTYYRKDPQVIDRLKEVLDMMIDVNYGNDKE